MFSTDNPQIQLAFDYVQYTGKNIFLTGKAGTGKTTFLKNLKQWSPKRMIVVAPTGVAAINAGGVTIHSFFQLPFSPFIPKEKTGNPEWDEAPVQQVQNQAFKFSREKINIMKSLDLLVIDEISMVRADILDAIDEVLRRYKNRFLPFGGTQLLMIGDLQQLPPVVKDEEWQLLKKYYQTMFFFGSWALQKTDYVSIELKHIYRQSDPVFIDLLNRIRDNNADQLTFKKLHERYIPDFLPDKEKGYITLTTHNAQALQINQEKLAKLPQKQSVFKARVKGDFPEYAYPTEFELLLKTGAQVMFIKNDISYEKLFYNGKIGIVERFEDELIYVRCENEAELIAVGPAEWKNMKYSINEETREITEEEIGTFIQYPLKLAWAITIHKSQGLTFEKAIIDANSAFAHGQVYVALSRCKSLEGLVLSSTIQQRGIISDKLVTNFNLQVEENQPDTEKLDKAKTDFEQGLIKELFDFKLSFRRIQYILKLIRENSGSLPPGLTETFVAMEAQAKTEILDVADKFHVQLQQLLAVPMPFAENHALQERIKKGSAYFSDKITATLTNKLEELNVESDNKTVKKQILDILNRLTEELHHKKICLETMKDGFEIKKYLTTRAKASIEKVPAKSSKQAGERGLSASIPNPDLFGALKTWRNNLADELGTDPYMVFPQKVLYDLASTIPSSLSELKKIKGLGKKKINQFGAEVLQILLNYRKGKDLKVPEKQAEIEESPKPEKTDSKKLSFDLFKTGKSIAEIAAERSMATTTIEGHLAHYVKIGELNVEQFVTPEKLIEISECFMELETTNLGPVKQVLGDDFSYAELRFVLSHLQKNGKVEF